MDLVKLAVDSMKGTTQKLMNQLDEIAQVTRERIAAVEGGYMTPALAIAYEQRLANLQSRSGQICDERSAYFRITMENINP
ncbi:MAG: hypothetical protein ABIG37_01220 [Nanoarchaeota archaeon]|nr:hypothetical protein [Nanoarchaeota archaeon]